MELVDINAKEFKSKLYKYYKKMFPRLERKPYKLLNNYYNLGICKFIKIIDNDKTIGF